MARYIGVVRGPDGTVAESVVLVYSNYAKKALATVYTNRELTVPTANNGTVLTNNRGEYSFYALPGIYTLLENPTGIVPNGLDENIFDVRIGLVDESWWLISTDADKSLKFRRDSNQKDVVEIKDSADANSLVVAADGNVGIGAASFGSGEGGLYIKEESVNPSTTPSGGGVLYADSATKKLMWRDSSGNDLIIADHLFAPTDEYHPDKSPDLKLVEYVHTASDDFVGGAAAGVTWTNSHVTSGGGATDGSFAYEWDALKITSGDAPGVSDESNSLSLVNINSYTASNLFVCAKVSVSPAGGGAIPAGCSCGVIISVDGPGPTKYFYMFVHNDGTNLAASAYLLDGSLLIGSPTSIGGPYTIGLAIVPIDIYLGIYWATSTNTLTFYFSLNGYSFRNLASYAVPATPQVTDAGLMNHISNSSAENVGIYHFFRTLIGDSATTIKIGN